MRTLTGYLAGRADPPWTNCLLFRRFISNFNTFYFYGLASQLSTSAISSHQSCTLRARLLSLDFLALDGCSHRYLLVIYDRRVPGPLALLLDKIRPSSSNGDLERRALRANDTPSESPFLFSDFMPATLLPYFASNKIIS